MNGLGVLDSVQGLFYRNSSQNMLSKRLEFFFLWSLNFKKSTFTIDPSEQQFCENSPTIDEKYTENVISN